MFNFEIFKALFCFVFILRDARRQDGRKRSVSSSGSSRSPSPAKQKPAVAPVKIDAPNSPAPDTTKTVKEDGEAVLRGNRSSSDDSAKERSKSPAERKMKKDGEVKEKVSR